MGMDVRFGDGSGTEDYRTCAECGGDCSPEAIESDAGSRVAFVCARCGLHSVVDPFADLR